MQRGFLEGITAVLCWQAYKRNYQGTPQRHTREYTEIQGTHTSLNTLAAVLDSLLQKTLTDNLLYDYCNRINGNLLSECCVLSVINCTFVCLLVFPPPTNGSFLNKQPVINSLVGTYYSQLVLSYDMIHPQIRGERDENPDKWYQSLSLLFQERFKVQFEYVRRLKKVT